MENICLGAPSRVFYKSEDKMKIHSPKAHMKAASLKSDYFFNYFQMGLVSLFSDATLLLKYFCDGLSLFFLIVSCQAHK